MHHNSPHPLSAPCGLRPLPSVLIVLPVLDPNLRNLSNLCYAYSKFDIYCRSGCIHTLVLNLPVRLKQCLMGLGYYGLRFWRIACYLPEVLAMRLPHRWMTGEDSEESDSPAGLFS